MPRPEILDAYCGAGLVAEGLYRAGWMPVGTDKFKQPNYPFKFIQMDFRDANPRKLAEFAALWGSPPCLKDTVMKNAPGAKGDAHPDLITPTRALFKASGRPYVIENVMGAELVNPQVLCGSMFNLGVDIRGERFHLERHRQFETNWEWEPPEHPAHPKPCIGVYGGHARCRSASHGGRDTADFQGSGLTHRQMMGRAMGILDARPITADEISQGIPPEYAEYIGRRLLIHYLETR
jgi:DNA (cytosine-5)-methyltransferase 1